jgi:hypothetical protein
MCNALKNSENACLRIRNPLLYPAELRAQTQECSSEDGTISPRAGKKIWRVVRRKVYSTCIQTRPDRFCLALRQDIFAEVSKDKTIPRGRRVGARDNKPMEATAFLNL